MSNKIYTPEDVSTNDIRNAIINELIKARNEQKISQKELEKLSGVKQPVIARIEKGHSDPQLETLIKLLACLGKKIEIISIR